MATPRLSPYQTAWVTTDLDHSVDLFRTSYGIDSFFVFESNLESSVFGKVGPMALRIALANIDNVQLEIIQSLGDGSGVEHIYSDFLPKDGGFAQRLHHICVKIDGTLDDWDRYVAALPADRPICYTAHLTHDTRFCYTDDRSLLGHYVEHVWFGEESAARMAANIPQFYSKG